MYTWSLYGWILAFIAPASEYYFVEDDIVLALFYLAFTAIILGHPVVQIMGCYSIFSGLMTCVIDFDSFDYVELLVPILLGLGLIAVWNRISGNRKFVIARCRPIFCNCCSRWRS